MARSTVSMRSRDPRRPDALVGVVGGSVARVAPDGRVRADGDRWSLDWWIGGDDRWHVPSRETAVRRSRPGAVPVVETAMRVPGGDAHHRVYGAAPGVFVVEVENASPVPFVLALVVRGARDVALDGSTAKIDGRPALLTARPPARWSVATTGADDPTFETVAGGLASAEVFVPRHDRRGRLDVALLYPVAHRTTLRAALVGPGAVPDVEIARLPNTDAVTRGWSTHLDRGLRVELPDEPLATAVRVARAELLLAGEGEVDGSGRRTAASADVVAALEDWGFDEEAAFAWDRLSGRGRRHAARRTTEPATWADVDTARARGDGPAMLLALRSVLVHEDDGPSIEVCAELPASWRGRDLEVHDAPTRRGSVSYAVRWHGARPALLWDVPEGTRLRAPGLDRGWSTSDARGEALLAAAEVSA